MAVATHRLKPSKTARIKLNGNEIRIRPGETVELDFAVQEQEDAVVNSGRLEADFDVVVQTANHKFFGS